MKKIIVVADIHGQYSCWKKVYSLLEPENMLIVAGDLFDTKYGNIKNKDFQPEKIRDEFIGMPHPKQYVYGNCDDQSFYPGQATKLGLDLFGKKTVLTHGHFLIPDISIYDIVIEGHSHIKRLEKKNGIIFLNPGSAAFPRDGVASYAEIKKDEILIRNIDNNDVLGGLTLY